MIQEYRVESQYSFDELCERVHKILPELGFSILSEIKTSDILRSKGYEYAALRTYDVCNPGYAYKALSLNKMAETAIPCRMIVKRADNQSEVAIQMPGSLFRDIDLDEDDLEFLKEMEIKLREIVDRVSR